MPPHIALDAIVLSQCNQTLQDNDGPEAGNEGRLSDFRLPGRLSGYGQLTLNGRKVTTI